MPTLKAIHIAKSHKANRTSLNLSISMSLPTLKKMLTKLKGIERMKKAQHLTKAMRNLGNILILRFIALNKISGKLKINRFKIPNYA